MDEELFRNHPRDYALKKVEDGLVSDETLALACLKFMSHDEVRDMLDANELSPRFSEDIDDDVKRITKSYEDVLAEAQDRLSNAFDPKEEEADDG